MQAFLPKMHVGYFHTPPRRALSITPTYVRSSSMQGTVSVHKHSSNGVQSSWASSKLSVNIRDPIVLILLMIVALGVRFPMLGNGSSSLSRCHAPSRPSVIVWDVVRS